MREIKFRALDMITNKWVYGLLYRQGSEGQWLNIQTENGISVNVIEESVGEFAALKDKNGREIYEGDLILIHQWNRKYEVIFESGMFKAKGNTRFSLCTATNGELTCEVIGNIYENPELLEGKR